jgi:quercetin dioxygenase-like cupin family protein
VFVETAAETGGARTVLELVVWPGGGNDPHRHLTYAETFTAVEGTLTVRLGRERLRLAPGASATAPPGAVHCFANETGEPVRARVEISPGSRGFERMLQAVYGLAEDGATNRRGIPRSLLHLAVLGDWGDVRLAGPMRALAPVFGLLVRIARRRGVDALLEERYVRI